MAIGDSSKRILAASRSDRKNLEDAMEYVAKGWMPISSQIINLVREKLQSGIYEENREEFLQDLKKDFSLFTWFLSKLGSLTEKLADQDSKTLDDHIRNIEINKLIEVFNEPDPNKNKYKRESALKPQAQALKQAIAAVATAESAASAKKLDSTMAHMCAGIRQLGVNLVAWNYPRIYARALDQSVNGKDSLDQTLSKILGYSPMELGTEISLNWDQSGSLAAFVTNDKEKLNALSSEEKASLGNNPDELFKCIDLGEKVSKLVAPELYPESVAKMPEIISDVEKVFGKGGMNLLKNTLASVAKEYTAEGENPLIIDIDPEKVGNLARSHLSSKLIDDNAWIAKCSESIKEKFKNLYGHLNPGGVSPTAINILVGEVIPNLGFTKGCVYLVESNRMRLNPVMRIGDSPLSRYRSLDFSSSDKSSHPVIVALGYTAPLIQENVAVNGEFVSHVTGVFGTEPKSGVLYLEMSPQLASSADRGEALLYFKAVRQALIDCLNLRK